jgi:RNA polymerase sigma-70 factor (ECF subfamily)
VEQSTLVERAARGDRGAFSLLVEGRLDRVFRMASAMLGSEADARDVTQDAFLIAWRQLPRLRERSRFDAWLNQIVRNRCRDVIRARRRSLEVELGSHDAVVPDAANAISEAAAVSAAFDRLRADQRQILVLHHLHQLRVEDLARQLGIRIGTAKWRLHHARRALERALESER